MSDEVRHKGKFIKKKELTRRQNVRKANIERSKQNRDKIVDKKRTEASARATSPSYWKPHSKLKTKISPYT